MAANKEFGSLNLQNERSYIAMSSSPEDETSDLDESSDVRLYFWILM
jgi:hypothetical protein